MCALALPASTLAVLNSMIPHWSVSSRGRVAIGCPACGVRARLGSHEARALYDGVCSTCKHRQMILDAFAKSVYGSASPAPAVGLVVPVLAYDVLIFRATPALCRIHDRRGSTLYSPFREP